MSGKTTETHVEMNELPPELCALEASLAAAKPHCEPAVKERAKAHALLEICREVAPESPDLIELILRSDERRISGSLREYVRAERFRATLIGGVIGLLLGVALNIAAMLTLQMMIMQMR